MLKLRPLLRRRKAAGPGEIIFPAPRPSGPRTRGPARVRSGLHFVERNQSSFLLGETCLLHFVEVLGVHSFSILFNHRSFRKLIAASPELLMAFWKESFSGKNEEVSARKVSNSLGHPRKGSKSPMPPNTGGLQHRP